MPTLFEYNNTNDNNDSEVRGGLWEAQTFAPQASHTISSVKMLVYRVGSPGTLTLSITATSGGTPSGADLTVGTTNANTLPTGSPYEWREITLSPTYDLQSGTLYSMVGRCPAGNGSNEVLWRAHVQFPDAQYTRGTECSSQNSGGTWTASNNWDMQFEEWGLSGFIPKIIIS